LEVFEMANQLGNNKDKGNKEASKAVSSEIFGEPLEDSEMTDVNPVQNEDVTTSLNSDQDFEREAVSGIKKTFRSTKEETSTSPEVTSNDIDADWQNDTASEEVSLGDNPTPDQDQIDAISHPWGTDYDTDEELDVQKRARILEQDREDDENKTKE
jgi:hypothetical protein